jgi:hypothetical protein
MGNAAASPLPVTLVCHGHRASTGVNDDFTALTSSQL